MEIKSPPASAPASIQDIRQHALGYVKLAEPLVHLLTEVERDCIRQEYLKRYKTVAAAETDPEYQIRMREVERDAERKKQDLQALLKLIAEQDQVLGQLARREKDLDARDRSLKELESRVRTRETEVELKAAEALASAGKQALETVAAAEKQASQKVAAAEKAAAAKQSEAEETLKRSEQEAKERIEAIAQTSREVDALQAKLNEELKHIDEVLNKAKSDLVVRLKQVVVEAQKNLDQARRDIEELLS